MSSIYILKLEGGKYYIGKSGNVERRFQDHMSGNGSVWTRLHYPIELEKVISNTSAFDEDRYVKEYMSIHGVDNVRGGVVRSKRRGALSFFGLRSSVTIPVPILIEASATLRACASS